MIREIFKKYRRTILTIPLSTVFLLGLVKFLYTWVHDPGLTGKPFDVKFVTCSSEVIDATLEHMDLVGYFVAIVAFIVSILIAFIIDSRTTFQLEEMKKMEKEIRTTNEKIRASAENLEDATRKVLETLPEILDESLRIVDKINESGQLYIMNYTSKFGVIHSFNKRFVQQVRYNARDLENPGQNDEKEFYCQRLNLIKDRIEELCRKTMDAAFQAQEFQMVTFADKPFIEDFVSKYLQMETKANSNAMLLYPYKEHGRVKPDEVELGDCVEKLPEIIEIVAEQHKRALKLLETVKESVVHKRNEIPYQMILAEYPGADGERKYESLVMYAVDETVSLNGRGDLPERNIIGISSKNKQLYKAFKTIFNDVKNN